MKINFLMGLLFVAAPIVFAQTTTQPNTGTPAATVTAVCKDGTQFKGTSLSGACSGHKGVDKSASAQAGAKATPSATITPPKSSTTAPATSEAAVVAGASAGKVWANASSKVYHCSGDKYFGKTKHGEFMTESDAKAKGFHASHGKICG